MITYKSNLTKEPKMGPPKLRKFLEFLSKTMCKIYDILLNSTEIFHFPLLFLGFVPFYNTSKKFRGGGGQAPNQSLLATPLNCWFVGDAVEEISKFSLKNLCSNFQKIHFIYFLNTFVSIKVNFWPVLPSCLKCSSRQGQRIRPARSHIYFTFT